MLSLRFPVSPPSQHKHRDKPITPILQLHASSKTIQTNTKNNFISSCLPKFRKQVVVARSVASNSSNAETVVSNRHLSNEDDEEELPKGLRRDLMPKHVAVILDGNRRWGQERGLSVDETHRAGGKKMAEIATLCRKWGVKVLTVFAFSTENWTPPKEEVDILMNLFGEQMASCLGDTTRYGIRVSTIGDKSKLPEMLQKTASQLEEATKGNSKFHIIVALNYGGQQDITQACKKVSGKVKEGLIEVEDITKSIIEQELETNCAEYPNPDLLIRTSGEIRVSNFMPWKLAYAEMLFVDKLWPDFQESDFAEALRAFQQRQRRYGAQHYRKMRI